MFSRGAQAPYACLSELAHLSTTNAKKNASLNKVRLGVIDRFANRVSTGAFCNFFSIRSPPVYSVEMMF